MAGSSSYASEFPSLRFQKRVVGRGGKLCIETGDADRLVIGSVVHQAGTSSCEAMLFLGSASSVDVAIAIAYPRRR